ncbi:MAG: hypothetical protein OEZ36_02400, partial [Spirochaetota bacterium]|nr:hypothetical protein [Spirochaetota bacterium]
AKPFMGGTMKTSYLFILCLILIFSHSPIQSADKFRKPVPPKTPNIPNSQPKTEKKPAQKLKSFTYSVIVFLARGSSTKGFIKLRQEHLSVTTKKGDFAFKKKIPYHKIRQIEIISWQERKIQQKNKKGEFLYAFYPIEFKVNTHDGGNYIYSSFLPAFHSFTLENIWGKTTIHSVFYDYWVAEGKGGYWHNSKLREFQGNRKKPNPLVLKKIVFERQK